MLTVSSCMLPLYTGNTVCCYVVIVLYTHKIIVIIINFSTIIYVIVVLGLLVLCTRAVRQQQHTVLHLICTVVSEKVVSPTSSISFSTKICSWRVQLL